MTNVLVKKKKRKSDTLEEQYDSRKAGIYFDSVDDRL